MAKPDCDDGYYKIAYELGAALLSFGFGEIEGHILAVVLETQYGLGKRKYVELSPAKLADEWQVDRSNIHRAIGRLVAHNVLLSLGDNQYQLLKDYANWEKKGAPGRVTLWKAFVADAPRRAKALRPLPPPKERDDLVIEGMPGVDDEPATVPMPVVSKDNTQADADQTPLSPKTTDRCPQRQQTVVSKDNSVGVPPRPPIGEAHAEFEKGRMGEEESVSLPHAREAAIGEPAVPMPGADDVSRMSEWASGRIRKYTEHPIRGWDEDWAVNAAMMAADLLQSRIPGFAIRQAIDQALAKEGMTQRRYLSYVPTTSAGIAAEVAAKQTATLPIGQPRPQQPPRVAPVQQRIQDQLSAIDAIAELERRTREGA